MNVNKRKIIKEKKGAIDFVKRQMQVTDADVSDKEQRDQVKE